jgi:hypothetical protein
MREAFEAAKAGSDCFGMIVSYLQGRKYEMRLCGLDESREGDILLFSSMEHGVALAIHAGKERAYTFMKGRIALLRFKDYLRNGQFLAGVRLE